MAGDAETAADRDLQRQLRELGLTAGARQFKRWREAHLLATPVRRAGGRGKGRASVGYPPEAVRQAVVNSESLQAGLPLRYIALILFYRDMPVSEEALRRAYNAVLDDLEAMLPPDEDRADATDKLAQTLRRRAKRSPLARRWIARSSSYGARAASPVEDTLTLLTGRMFGGDDASEQTESAATEVLGVPHHLAPEFHEVLANLLSLSELRQVARSATYTQLQTARRTHKRMLALADALSQMQAVTGHPIASGLADATLPGELENAVAVLAVAAQLRRQPELEQLLAQAEHALIDAGTRLDLPRGDSTEDSWCDKHG